MTTTGAGDRAEWLELLADLRAAGWRYRRRPAASRYLWDCTWVRGGACLYANVIRWNASFKPTLFLNYTPADCDGTESVSISAGMVRDFGVAWFRQALALLGVLEAKP